MGRESRSRFHIHSCLIVEVRGPDCKANSCGRPGKSISIFILTVPLASTSFESMKSKDLSPRLFSLRKILLLLAGAGLMLFAGMLFVPNAASAVWEIRWYPLQLSCLLLLLLGCVGWMIGRPNRTSGPRRFSAACSALLALGFLGGALYGPFPARALTYSVAPLTALACASLLLLRVSAESLLALFRSKSFQSLTAGLILLWCGFSLYHFLTRDLLPLLALARRLDNAAGGGIYELILQQKLPAARNAFPLGHANYTSGFLLLLLPLLVHGIREPAAGGIRMLSVSALILGIVVLLSTQSRNALLGLGVAGAAYLWWKGSSPKRLLCLTGAGITGFLVLMLLLPRFQTGIWQISPGRWGMWTAAWRTGQRYFPFGCGEGLTPEMMSLFTPDLSSVWENALQFHQTWLHLWAVGGVAGALGMLGLTLGCGWTILTPWRADPANRPAMLPSVMALAAGLVVFLADYQLDVFPLALLLLGHVMVLTVLAVQPGDTEKSANWGKAFAVIPAICLLISATVVPASWASRIAIDRAGSAYEQEAYTEAVTHYLTAHTRMKEPYALNMAGVVMAKTDRQAAIGLFNQSLSLWEPQVLPHEYLVDLWIKASGYATDPDIRRAALKQALHHARRRTDLAPQLKGSFLDLAWILHQLNASPEEVSEALYYEMLMQGELLFPQSWELLGDLRPYQSAVTRRLMQAEIRGPRPLRTRLTAWQSYLYLMGAVPEDQQGFEAVRTLIAERTARPGALNLLAQLCRVEDAAAMAGLRRLLVYLFESPVSEQTVRLFLENRDPGLDCMASYLQFGQARMRTRNFAGVGITARHPYSIPVVRPRAYPDVFGGHFLPQTAHKPFSLTDAAPVSPPVPGSRPDQVL